MHGIYLNPCLSVCLSVVAPQLGAQGGPLPAGCFLFGSHLPPDPATVLLGVQGCPCPRTFGCLQLPGGRRQCVVSLATLWWKYVKVSFCEPRDHAFIDRISWQIAVC